MRKLIFNLLFIVSGPLAFGTAQIPDILIYKGDTISLFDCPLAYLPNQELYNREAERVVKSIPDWDVVYRHGERSIGYRWSIPIVFDWKK